MYREFGARKRGNKDEKEMEKKPSRKGTRQGD